MYCKYLSKSLNGNLRCLKTKTITYISNCQECLKFEPHTNKCINRVSKKQKKLENNRFSIFTTKFDECYYCKRKIKENERLDLHEVYGGSNRTRSIKNGFVVPLCRLCHSNEEIINILRIKLQKEYEKTHGREEFIKIIGKSYIKEE